MTKFDHEAVKAANRERNAAIMKAFWGTPDDSATDMRESISRALHTIAGQMRERGQALVEAKRKGAIGTNKTLAVAATELENVAQSLTTDGAEEIRAAAQVAGVAVSLSKDGVGYVEMGLSDRIEMGPAMGPPATPPPGLPLSEIIDVPQEAPVCGATHDFEDEITKTYGSVYCVRQAGHADYHIYRDEHGEIAWEARECGAVPQYGPPSDDRCALPEGHSGNHEGSFSRWPHTEFQVAGVAVSLAKDGVSYANSGSPIMTEGPVAPNTIAVTWESVSDALVFDNDGMPVAGAIACGVTHDFENVEAKTYGSVFCNRHVGHEGDHAYRDAHGVIEWSARDCGAVPQYGPPSDDRCTLPEQHAGNHQGAWSRWPHIEERRDVVDSIDDAWSGEILAPDPVPGYGDEEPADGMTVSVTVDTSAFTAALEIVAPDHEPVVIPQPYVLDEAIARPRREHRSVSQIELYNECGMKYRLSYRDPIEGAEVPAWWNVGGTAFHRCAEVISKRWPDLGTWEADAGRDEAASRFDELWRREFADEIAKTQLAGPAHPMSTWRAADKGAEGREWWYAAGPEMVAKLYAWHCSRLREGWTVSGTEIEFTHDVEGVPVYGFIDRVDTRVTDVGPEVEVVDYKAGGTKPKDSFQLGMYADYVNATSAGYYFARKGEFAPTTRPVREKHPHEEIVHQTVSMDHAEQAGIYLANTATGFGGCGSCSMKRHCPIGSRR